MQELELADSAESLNSIDILIGSNHYLDFVTGESIRGDFGPAAVKSKLRWLLSGPTKIHKRNKCRFQFGHNGRVFFRRCKGKRRDGGHAEKTLGR